MATLSERLDGRLGDGKVTQVRDSADESGRDVTPAIRQLLQSFRQPEGFTALARHSFYTRSLFFGFYFIFFGGACQ